MKKAKILIFLYNMAGKMSEIFRQTHEATQPKMQERMWLRFSWMNFKRQSQEMLMNGSTWIPVTLPQKKWWSKLHKNPHMKSS